MFHLTPNNSLVTENGKTLISKVCPSNIHTTLLGTMVKLDAVVPCPCKYCYGSKCKGLACYFLPMCDKGYFIKVKRI